MKLGQVSTGKLVSVVHDASLAYTVHSGAPVLLAQNTGIKPIDDHHNGKVVEVLDGEYATCRLIVPSDTEVAH